MGTPFDQTVGKLVPTYTVATLPAGASMAAGVVVYVSNGSAGAACLAFSDGTIWRCANSLAECSAT